MNWPFVRCREEDEYQRMLVHLLAEECRLFEVPIVVAKELLCSTKDLGYL